MLGYWVNKCYIMHRYITVLKRIFCYILLYHYSIGFYRLYLLN